MSIDQVIQGAKDIHNDAIEQYISALLSAGYSPEDFELVETQSFDTNKIIMSYKVILKVEPDNGHMDKPATTL